MGWFGAWKGLRGPFLGLVEKGFALRRGFFGGLVLGFGMGQVGFAECVLGFWGRGVVLGHGGLSLGF